MNIITRWFVEKGAQKMMDKLASAVKGYKTYLLAALGIVIALIGHFYGPVNIGGQQIPAMDWSEVWKIVWASGLFSALRHGVDSTPS